MTQSSTPEFVQTLIVLANTRKQLLSAALDNARRSLERTPRAAWQPYVETADEKRARDRAERLDWIIHSL